VAANVIVPVESMVTFCTAAVPLALASFYATDARQVEAWAESDASVTVNHTARDPARPW
jgi:hypothetical protein